MKIRLDAYDGRIGARPRPRLLDSETFYNISDAVIFVRRYKNQKKKNSILYRFDSNYPGFNPNTVNEIVKEIERLAGF